MKNLIKKIINIKFQFLLIILGVLIAPAIAFAVVQSLNGQTGMTQSFANDINVTMTSFNDIHSLGWSGSLPVSRGGTGNDAFMEGSVIFMGQNKFRQDNNNLFWDRVNNRLGIGTTGPTTTLDVVGDASVSGNLTIGSNIVAGNLSGTNTGDQNLSGLVPYTGATQNVVLGNFGIVTPNVSALSSDNPSPLDIGAGSAISGDASGAYLNMRAGGGSGTGGGGTTSIYGGTGGEIGGGGSVALFSRDGGTTSGNAGSIELRGGTATVGRGGSINLLAGPGGSTSGNGGSVTIAAGNATAGNSQGGNVNFGAGVGTGGGADGTYYFFSPAGGVEAILDTSILTSTAKTFILPNSSGTFGLLEANQIWGGLNKFEASTNSTIYVGSSIKSGCIAMGDSDGSGITYVTANDGVLSASATKPGICQ